MGENTLECDTLRFSGNVAPAVAKVGSLFPRFHASIWESCRQKVHRTEAGPRFALQKRKKMTASEHIWEDEVGKMCARPSRKLDFIWKKVKKMRGARSMAKKVRSVDAARMLVDLVY